MEVGDKVIINYQSHGWGEVKQGDEAIILRITNEATTQGVRNLLSLDTKAMRGWTCYDNCVTPVIKTPLTLEQIKLKEEIDNFSF